jgi:hypothetical protein
VAHVGAATLHCRTRTWSQRGVGCTNAVMGWGLLSVCWVNQCPAANGGVGILAHSLRHAEEALARRHLACSVANLCASTPAGVYIVPRHVRVGAFAGSDVPIGLVAGMRSEAVETRRESIRVGFVLCVLLAHVRLPLHGSHYRAV